MIPENHLVELTRLSTLTETPSLSLPCQAACGSLFKKIWKLEGKPLGDPDFGKKAFFNEGGCSVTPAIRFQALKHILTKNTRLYLLAVLDALQASNLPLARELLTRLEVFDPSTMAAIKAACTDVMTTEVLSDIQESVEQVFITQALDAWVAESSPEEKCAEARAKILYYLKTPALTSLDLSNLGLKSLPNIFNVQGFKKTTTLNLDNNQLAALPPSFGNLARLTYLDLSGNPLVTHLAPRDNWVGYSSVPVHPDSIPSAAPFYAPGSPIPAFPHLVRDSGLATITAWLERVHSLLTHYPQEAQTKVKEIVREFLEKAETNEEFRPFFVAITAESMKSCVDGITLSFMHLRVALLKLHIDISNLRETAETLRVFVILSMLEGIAREKINALRAAGTAITHVEREAFLIYPARLKDVFGLPVDITEMTFAGATRITDADIETARIAVEETLSDPLALHRILMEDLLWEEALQLNNPEAYRALVREAEAFAEDLADNASLLRTLQAVRESELAQLSLDTTLVPLPGVDKRFFPSLQAILRLGINAPEKDILLALHDVNTLTGSDLRFTVINQYNATKSAEYPSLSPSYEGCGEGMKFVDSLLLLQLTRAALIEKGFVA